jgi:hypothetical protein
LSNGGIQLRLNWLPGDSASQEGLEEDRAGFITFWVERELAALAQEPGLQELALPARS